MVDEGAIHCDQLEPCNIALGEQQPIERIPSWWFGIQGVQNVRDFDPEYPQSKRCYSFW